MRQHQSCSNVFRQSNHFAHLHKKVLQDFLELAVTAVTVVASS
jgi:hypothetical protein